jgi:hypothetical protein
MAGLICIAASGLRLIQPNVLLSMSFFVLSDLCTSTLFKDLPMSSPPKKILNNYLT